MRILCQCLTHPFFVYIYMIYMCAAGEGELMIKKKTKDEIRYCVLRTDCFEYFLNKSDYNSGAPARCCCLMEDITGFEV